MYATTNFDWPLIRKMYEKGLAPGKIVKQLSPAPSRQAVAQRAKKEGWTRVLVSVAGDKEDCTPAALTQQFGKDTPESRAQVIDSLSKGVSLAVASRIVGVHPDTLLAWRKGDPDFSVAVDAARAAFLTRHHANIDKAGDRDWRASSYLLERQDETRRQFAVGTSDPSGLVIVLNIERDRPLAGRDDMERDAIEAEYAEVAQ